MKDYTPEEAVFAQQRGEEIGFDTPEEVIEFARRGGQVDNACLRHAFQDLPRPTPEEAVEQQRAGHTPIIGFAFDTPAEIIEFCRLGGRVNPGTKEAAQALIDRGETSFMAAALVGAQA